MQLTPLQGKRHCSCSYRSTHLLQGGRTKNDADPPVIARGLNRSPLTRAHQQADNRIFASKKKCALECLAAKVSMHSVADPFHRLLPLIGPRTTVHILQLAILFHYQALGPSNTLRNETLIGAQPYCNQRRGHVESAATPPPAPLVGQIPRHD